ncbi:hypothetical protein [Rickettsia australis]|uniref:Uncharacterized protein n=1 Tax=Rickettsia australis (strain Cutlack) TaxID=1105110 RepID=H8K6U1_RICAC|nr:hypothetical protein [Rickettsia australis]AFC70984.1 hypothetical protein MC5_03180 [Rickettsia australis str. Cutlack]
MSELGFKVEKTSFIVSVIDAIEEYIKAEFLFDYNQSMPIENVEVMKEFFRLKSEFRKYIKE